jgi:hypothetical protein
MQQERLLLQEVPDLCRLEGEVRRGETRDGASTEESNNTPNLHHGNESVKRYYVENIDGGLKYYHQGTKPKRTTKKENRR